MIDMYVNAGVAQRQSTRLVSAGSRSRNSPPAPESRLTNSGTALRGVMTPSRVREEDLVVSR